ncbi:MAG: cyclase family protein [Alphaproteobacteria bacterium]
MSYGKWGVILAACLVAGMAKADDVPEMASVEQFDAWMEEVSNWGRWGDDDQKGTLNLITPEKRVAAAALVEDGMAVSMALDLNKTQSDLNANPFEHTLQTIEFEGHYAAGDRYAIEYHGYAHSHLDGLPHFSYRGEMYNGVPVAALKETGSERLGIENAYEGIFTRGVLVDMAWLKGVDYLPADAVITADDLEEWETRTGVTIGSGDVLLLRTGRWERMRQNPTDNFLEGAAGFHASVATWLRDRDVAVIGCDGISDAIPSRVATKPNALHELVLVGIGMMIFDNLELDAVAEAAKARERWEFLFVAAPLRVPGGTGSPVNPLAIF